jgi:PGF-CTERM protein
MAHRDTDGDRSYSFVASNGETDGPYTADGSAVVDTAAITVSATVSMDDGVVANDTVVVDRVELSEGGFVTIHDATVTEGAVFDSIRGTSQYLEAGVHENVRVTLDEPLTENTTLVPMAHVDSDGDETYTFEESEGGADGPYTANGSAVVDTAAVTIGTEATVSFANQSTGGERVVVDEVFLPEGGFVTVHDATVTEGAVFDSIRGTSTYLAPGTHEDVEVVLEEPVTEDTTLVPMAHKDTDGDMEYTFEESEGGADGPYTADGGAVVDTGTVTLGASVSMADQVSDGRTVVVEDVDLAEGGFVTIHDSSLFAGAVFESVLGTSEYLEAGHHEEVTITLDQPVRSTQTLVPMAHMDSDGDETYTFAESEGEADGPYTYDGGAVVDTARVQVGAFVSMSDQETDGTTVVVDSVTLQDGGFVTVHDATVTEGAVFESIRGTSAYLGPGTHENVEITLDAPLEEDTTLVPMAHYDTDGDETYTFAESEGAADGPYVYFGGAVVDTASATVTGSMDDGTETDSDDESMETTEMDDGTTMMEETTAMDGTEMDGEGESDDGGSPGFGIAVALVALVAAAGLARRRADR